MKDGQLTEEANRNKNYFLRSVKAMQNKCYFRRHCLNQLTYWSSFSVFQKTTIFKKVIVLLKLSCFNYKYEICRDDCMSKISEKLCFPDLKIIHNKL